MKTSALITILFCFSLFGCQTKSKSSGEIISIDMNQAFDQSGSIKLSELVKSVEIVQFYPAIDTYFINVRSFSVGKKYIMINDDGGVSRPKI